MSIVKLTVVIPTLKGGLALDECLASLRGQTFHDFEIVLVANGPIYGDLNVNHFIQNDTNGGYGKAINQGVAASNSDYVLALNDDTVLDPTCLQALVGAMDSRYEIGMCAPQIRMLGSDLLDSTGMLIAKDGTSKQRSHGQAFAKTNHVTHALFPSGCAALYRRAMLDEVGLFPEDFFLYCEDTDLGLRARWKAWECSYVPNAIVEHRYSHSTSKASAAKAYYVERNRILVVFRNFPMKMLLLAPFHSLTRYFWHWYFKRQGRGAAAQYEGSESLASILFRAWRDAVACLPECFRERRKIQQTARLTARQFEKLLATYSITGRQVASQ